MYKKCFELHITKKSKLKRSISKRHERWSGSATRKVVNWRIRVLMSRTGYKTLRIKIRQIVGRKNLVKTKGEQYERNRGHVCVIGRIFRKYIILYFVIIYLPLRKCSKFNPLV